MKTIYIYKGWDRDNALAIIGNNVAKEKVVAEVKRLAQEHGELTVRNSLGGLNAVVTPEGKIQKV